MRQKNFIKKNLNIRFFRYLIFKALSKSNFLQKKLNISTKYIAVEDISGLLIKEYSEIYNFKYTEEEKDFFNLPENITFYKKLFLLKNVTFNGKTGTSTTEDSLVIANDNLSGMKVNKNEIHAKILNKITSDDSSIYVNCLGLKKGHKHIYHFYERLACIYSSIYYHNDLIKNYTEIRKIVFVVRKDQSHFQKLFYSLLPKFFGEFEIKVVILNDNEKLFCKQVLHSSTTSSYKRNFIDFETVKFINEIYKSKFKNSDITFLSKNIFLSRKDSKIRNLKNEKEILKIIDSYKVILAAHHAPLEQVKIFNNAINIIAIHGAGLSNLIFSKSNTKILELFLSNHSDGAYFILCKMLNLDYNFLVGSEGDSLQSFYINQESFYRKVNELNMK